MQAVASMATDDKDPRSTMSRNKETGKVATGGRRIKHHHFPSIHRDTWPTSRYSKDADQSPKTPSIKRKRGLKEKTTKPKKAPEQPLKPEALSARRSRPPIGTTIAASSGGRGG